MARDYAAEYERSLNLAHERGFDSVAEYREATREYRELVERGEVAGEEGWNGEERHDFIAFLIDELGYSLDEALEEMRDIFGETP